MLKAVGGALCRKGARLCGGALADRLTGHRFRHRPQSPGAPAGHLGRLRYETCMTLPALFDRLRLPVIGSPLFIISGARSGHRAVQGGDRRLLPGAQRPAAEPCSTNGCTASPRNWPRTTATHPDRPGRALRGQPDRPPLERPARGRSGDLRQMAGADRHHLARRARGTQPRRSMAGAGSRCTTSSTIASRTRRSKRAPTG